MYAELKLTLRLYLASRKAKIVGTRLSSKAPYHLMFMKIDLNVLERA